MSEHIWGPELDKCSMENFEPRVSDIPTNKIEFFDTEGQLCSVPSLALLESSLYRCDPRIYGTVSMNMNTVSTALVDYSLGNGIRNIFQYYYGFLCVRYFLHITCLAALGPTRYAVNRIISTLPQNASWEDLCNRISTEALDKAAQAMENPTSFDEFCRVLDDHRFSGYMEGESPKELYVVLTATMFWAGRDSFFTLCQRGLLPGSTLLLVIALKLALSDSVKETSYDTLNRLKDLAFRAYLAGSHQERQILQFVCMPVFEKEKPEDYDLNPLVDSEDSQKISRAYFGLLPRWRQDNSDAKTISVGFMSNLTGLALHMAVSDDSATVQGKIDAIEVSLRLLWLLFEHKGQILAADHSHFRSYGLIALVMIIVAQNQDIPTAQEQHRFSRMCASVELVALTGRILLLMLNEGSACPSTDVFEGPLIDMLPLLGTVMKDLAAAAPELFYDSEIECAKVLRQFLEYQPAGSMDRDKQKLVLHHTNKVISAWVQFTKPLEDEHCKARSCAYPRCSGLSLPELSIRYICGRCNSVTYCSSSCQHAHWELTTSESHKLSCGQPDHQVKDLEAT